MQTPEKVEPKKSRAIKLWLAVIIVVLTVLLIEMKGNSVTAYNLFIEGSAGSAGSEVLIDGTRYGALAKLTEPGVTGIGLRLNVPGGRHRIVVTKPNYLTFSAEFDVKGAQFLAVDLQPEKQ